MNIANTIRLTAVCLLMSYSTISYSQDRIKAKLIIDELCSDEMAGRGYINDGDLKAAEYIASSFSELGLSMYNESYFQKFSLPVNTIPEVSLDIDGARLRPGYDYLVAPSSGTVSISSSIFFVSERLLRSPRIGEKVKKAVKKGYLPVISVYDPKDKELSARIAEIKDCIQGESIVFLKDHLTWSVARNQREGSEVWLLDSVFNRYSKDIELKVEAKFTADYSSQNVIGYVPGTEFPDSVVIFCGHYDHLGKMGEAIFYGANDNASGISILIDMASYFKNNPQKYSIAFIAFGAEEAGLVGSYHYVNSPLVSLEKTKFVFNMDLMGSGEDGATIVNGNVFKEDFERFKNINDQNGYLPRIKARGKAANSDHYFFSEKGVPSFFIYLMGEYKHYHIPADNASNLELSEYYDKSYLLIRDFIISLNR